MMFPIFSDGFCQLETRYVDIRPLTIEIRTIFLPDGISQLQIAMRLFIKL